MHGVTHPNAIGARTYNMNWDNVTLDGDTTDSQFWVDLFRDRPEALFDLLYDVYATKKGKLGRGRRKKMNGSLQELWDLFYGDNT